MKLDMDCVRDVLLCVEKNTDSYEVCRFVDERAMMAFCAAADREPEEIPGYQSELQERHSNNKLVYHVRYCVEAGLLKSEGDPGGSDILIPGLTVAGHEFVENIRNGVNWDKAKKTAALLGSFSLGVLQQVAANVCSPK